MFFKKLHGKGRTFQLFFSKQCSLMANSSERLTSPSFRTNKRLSFVPFSAEDVQKIIQDLDPNRAHGNDN